MAYNPENSCGDWSKAGMFLLVQQLLCVVISPIICIVPSVLVGIHSVVNIDGKAYVYDIVKYNLFIFSVHTVHMILGCSDFLKAS